MSLAVNDFVRLKRLLDAGEQALSYCAGRSRADLDSDAMITVIGFNCSAREP
jgi:hypothetical protein